MIKTLNLGILWLFSLSNKSDQKDCKKLSLEYLKSFQCGKINEIVSNAFKSSKSWTEIKLIRLLRFNKKISYLTKTITNCSKDLISFMIVLLILWLAYVQLMYIFYNEKTLGYASFVKAMVTNFLIIMGNHCCTSSTNEQE